MKQGVAVLGSKGDYSSFTYGPTTIRFRTSKNLQRWVKVKSWDQGYIVAEALYAGHTKPVEEYIDLVPILQNLYFDPKQFLAPIKEVKIEQTETQQNC